MDSDTAMSFLATLQLADSFFPTGGYVHSQGLEGMVRRELVRNAADVEEFLGNSLTQALIPADGVALLNAHRAALAGATAELVAIDHLLHASKLAAELRAASRQVGRRLLAETAALVVDTTHAEYRAAVAAGAAPGHAAVAAGAAPGHAAVALGATAAARAIPAETALLAFCHTHSVGVLGAALRLLPFTHSQAQAILHRLHPTIAHEVRRIRRRHWRNMGAFAPELDLVAIGHETEDLRQFAS